MGTVEAPAMFYDSGEPIFPGDAVTYAGSPGRVRFVVGQPETDATSDSDSWYAEEYGGGFMIETDAWGLIFFEEADEDLELAARADPA